MAATRTIRLLVVEDSPSYRYFIETAFHGHSGEFQWNLTVVTDGQMALDFLFAEEKERAPLPDIMLLDWNLPKVNGSEVLRRMKEHGKLRRIPVIVFSSSEAERDIHEAYDNHANGYITKPDSSKMMEMIIEGIERFWIAIAQLPKVVR